jgi:hypothetical protein
VVFDEYFFPVAGVAGREKNREEEKSRDLFSGKRTDSCLRQAPDSLSVKWT